MRSLSFLTVLVVFAMVLLSLAQTIPISIACPYDGYDAGFTRAVGYGKQRVCWYKHSFFESGRRQTHEFYVECPDQSY